jgi:Rod binding domain-containing protein
LGTGGTKEQGMQAGAISAQTNAHQSAAAPSPRLVRAAHEFEGQMMKELLKPMTEGDQLTGAGDDSDSDSGMGSGGALNEFASESLGQALSQRGGFGVANRIVQELSHSGNQRPNGDVTGNPHPNAAIKTSQ